MNFKHSLPDHYCKKCSSLCDWVASDSETVELWCPNCAKQLTREEDSLNTKMCNQSVIYDIPGLYMAILDLRKEIQELKDLIKKG